MALTPEYFDSIQIDVVKKKYYNANKVNAVFEDIRRQAAELTRENEILHAALRERENNSINSESLLSMQRLYRDTLLKARARAEAMLQSAEESKEKIRRDAERSAIRADSLFESCMNQLRTREEENLAFLEQQLQQFRDGAFPDGKPECPPEEQEELQPDALSELESRISLLAKEIDALENN